MRVISIFIFFMLFGLFRLSAQDIVVIGYVPYYRLHLIDDIQFQKLTHVNVSFANPDIEGNLDLGGKNIDPLILKAHAEGVKVFLSLAGGALTADWAAAWKHLMKTENRSDFIHKILQYSWLHELDGIDVDLEWSHVDELYSGFILELKDSLTQYNIPLTAALPGTYRYPQISADALAAFDWINMMVYDLRGPWDPSNPGPHSPMSFAFDAINYWTGEGVAKSRLTLGMPFYGYDFSDPYQVRALTYAQIVNRDVANAYRDQDGDTYYNGIPTIREKTQLAIDELAGVMMWELGQDKFDQYSLLTNIDEVVQLNISAITTASNITLEVFPNPFQNEISIKCSRPITGILLITNINGQQIIKREIEWETETQIIVSDVPSGMYILTIILDRQVVTKKIIKR